MRPRWARPRAPAPPVTIVRVYRAYRLESGELRCEVQRDPDAGAVSPRDYLWRHERDPNVGDVLWDLPGQEHRKVVVVERFWHRSHLHVYAHSWPIAGPDAAPGR